MNDIPDPFKILEKKPPEETMKEVDYMWDFYCGLLKSAYKGTCRLLSRIFRYTGDTND